MKEVHLSSKTLLYIFFVNLLSLAFFYLSGKRIDSTKNINWYYMGLGIAMQFQILWILLKNRHKNKMMEVNMVKEVRLSIKNLINIYFHNLLAIGCFYVFGKNFDSITHTNWSFAILGIAMQLQILRILLKNRYLKD